MPWLVSAPDRPAGPRNAPSDSRHLRIVPELNPAKFPTRMSARTASAISAARNKTQTQVRPRMRILPRRRGARSPVVPDNPPGKSLDPPEVGDSTEIYSQSPVARVAAYGTFPSAGTEKVRNAPLRFAYPTFFTFPD